jgi:hypothetical protein
MNLLDHGFFEFQSPLSFHFKVGFDLTILCLVHYLGFSIMVVTAEEMQRPIFKVQ